MVMGLYSGYYSIYYTNRDTFLHSVRSSSKLGEEESCFWKGLGGVRESELDKSRWSSDLYGLSRVWG